MKPQRTPHRLGVSLVLRGRGLPGRYRGLFCPDSRRLAPGLRLHKVLRSHELSARIDLWEWNVIVQRPAGN